MDVTLQYVYSAAGVAQVINLGDRPYVYSMFNSAMPLKTPLFPCFIFFKI